MYEKIHSATDDIIEEYIRISGQYGLNLSVQDFILLRQQAVKESNGILHGNSMQPPVQIPSQTFQKAPEQEIEDTVKEIPKRTRRTSKRAETAQEVPKSARNDERNREYQTGEAEHEKPAPLAQQTTIQPPASNGILDPMAVLSRRKDALNM